MSAIDIISYILNIIFVTYGVTSFFEQKKLETVQSNHLNGAYEMAKRLMKDLKGSDAHRAEDIASSIKSSALSCANQLRDEINSKKGGV